MTTITLLTSGTLGDVRPFVALGRGLQRAGYHVRLATHVPFGDLVRRHGLAFAPLAANPSDLLQADPAALTLEDGPLRALAATWRFVRAAQPVYERLLESAWRACRASDALVVALPTTWGAQIAEALGVPCVFAPLQPLTRTRAWPSALLPVGRSLGPRLNLLTHQLVELSLRLPWRGPLRRWRREVLGLPPASCDPLALAAAGGAPITYGFSAWLVPRPGDWPAHHVATGFWLLEEEAQHPPPAALVSFLARGEPPVYIGFGSMAARRPAADARLVLDAVRRAGVRAVILGGEEARRLAAGRSDVCVVESAPHGWLLPRVAAAIHHGGAGTTAASLLAGAPTAVVPFAADQLFWGRCVARAGAGPPPVSRRALTAERLAELIRAVGGGEHRRRARALAQLLRREDGVARAAEHIAEQIGFAS